MAAEGSDGGAVRAGAARRRPIYIISGGKLKSTTPDGKSQEVEYKTGEVIWREAITHCGENIGTTELHAILVETKEPKSMQKETKK